MIAATKVKKIINEKGLKQSAIAKQIGMDPKTFNGLLNCRKTFDVAFLIPICKALNMSPNDLLGYKDEQ